MLVIQLRDIVDAFLALRLLNLHIDDRAVCRWVPEHRNLILEVVD